MELKHEGGEAESGQAHHSGVSHLLLRHKSPFM
jgi:hypothetical protein